MSPLKEYRKKINATQEELAELLGISQTLVSHIEKGLRPITPTQAINIEKKTKNKLKREELRPDIFSQSG
jgi:DNA-binding transcriptional regulator YdaS (Cro superfamily)